MFISLFTIESGLNPILFAVAKKPGMIVGPIAKLLGGLFNFLFEFIYNISPVGSLALAIILFTVIIKTLLSPLMVKQQKSTYIMQKIQPEMKKIQDKYKGKTDAESQRKMSYELQKLQKDNGVSLFGGCLPMLIQLPILYALFYIFQNAYEYVGLIGKNYDSITNIILSIPIELRAEVLTPVALPISTALKVPIDPTSRESIILLLNNLTTADWNTIFGGLGADVVNSLKPLIAQKDLIENFFGINLITRPGLTFPGIIIPILSALSTFLSSKVLTAKQNKDKKEEDNSVAATMNTMIYVMPVMMGIICINSPAALGIYWTFSNIVQMIQSLIINSIVEKKYKNNAI